MVTGVSIATVAIISSVVVRGEEMLSVDESENVAVRVVKTLPLR